MQFIDSHVHFWDLTQGINDWIKQDPELNQNFSLDDYLNSNSKPVAVMTVEAANSKDSFTESKWIEQFIAKNNLDIVIKHIAFIDMLQDHIEFKRNLEPFLALNLVVGFRHILSFSKLSKYSPNKIDVTTNHLLMQNFALNLSTLKQYNYIFECQMYPEQLFRMANIIINSGVKCIVDHCGLPLLHSNSEYDLWLNMLRLYQNSTVCFKLSGFDLNKNLTNQAEITAHMLHSLNINQLVFGSNYPLTRSKAFENLYNNLTALDQEQRNMIFLGNLNNWLRV